MKIHNAARYNIVWMAMLSAAMMQTTATTLAPLVDALALGLIRWQRVDWRRSDSLDWLGSLRAQGVVPHLALYRGWAMCPAHPFIAALSLFVVAGGAGVVGLVDPVGAT